MPKYLLCSSITKPRTVPFPSTKGTDVYFVALSTPVSDGACTCRGFTFRETCKHLTEAERDRCKWIAEFEEGIDYCPHCGNPSDVWEEEIKFV